MPDAVRHVVPGLILSSLGVALLWYVPRSFVRFRRTGFTKVSSIRLGWTPFGDWDPLVSGLRSAVQGRKEEVKTSELRRPWVVYLFLGASVVLAAALLMSGYHYLGFGQGFGS